MMTIPICGFAHSEFETALRTRTILSNQGHIQSGVEPPQSRFTPTLFGTVWNRPPLSLHKFHAGISCFVQSACVTGFTFFALDGWRHSRRK